MSSSQNDLQNGIYNSVRRFKHAIGVDISNAFIARIVKYDSKHHTADVQPLANLSSGDKSAQYLDVPVAKNCYLLDNWFDGVKSEFSKLDGKSGTNLSKKLPKQHLMHKSATVVCVVLDRDLDNWSGGSTTFTPNSGRLHDPNDSVIVAVL